MKRKWMLVAATVLAIVMAVSLGLVGCKTPTTTTAAAETATAAETTAAAETTTKESGEVVEISGLFWKGEAQEGMDALNQKFNELNPNIKVTVAIAAAYEQTLQGRISAGDPPDLIGIRAGNYSLYIIEGGNVMDLTGQPFLSNVRDDILKAQTYDGKVWYLPIDAAAVGCIYNKKVYSDLNLSVPKTWDEFIKNCDAIKAAGIIPVVYPGADSWTLLQALCAFAAPLVYGPDPDFDIHAVRDGTKSYAGPEWTKALDYYTQVRDNYANKDFNSLNYATANQMMASGEAAMAMQGIWDVAAIQSVNPDADLGFFIPPTADTPLLILGSDFAFGVSSVTKHKTEALKYLDYLTSKDAYEIWTSKVKTISTMKGSPMDFDSVVKDVQSIIDSGVKTYPLLNHGWFNMSADADIPTLLQSYNLGDLSSADTLKTLGDIITAAYKK